MSKARRRVTVDIEKPVPDDPGKRKPSVFERLGPGGAQRKYEEQRSDSQYLDKCRNWLLTGTCPFGSQCKFQHGPFIGKRKAKSSTSRKEDSPDDLRLRVKGHHGDSDSASPDPHARQKREKEMKMKSTIVVKKSGGHESGDESDDSDNWALEKLDYKKELELEQKRQQLQRELSQLAAQDDERENITIEKKLPKPPEQRPVTDKSDSDRSPDRGHFLAKKKSPITPKKEKKRKHKQRSPISRSPSPVQSPVKMKAHKKKYDMDDLTPHKVKHKKAKKLLRKQMEKSPEIGALRTKKKHTPKQPEEKLAKSGRDLPPQKPSPDTMLNRPRSPLKSDRQKMYYSRSRSRSPSFSPEPVKTKVIPDFVKEGLREGKYKIKKKKEKIRDNSPLSDHDQKSHLPSKKKESPMKIKKKNKIKHDVPVPRLKNDIEEDLPERHTDSEGRSGSSESYSRRREEESRERKDRETQELKHRVSDKYDRRDRYRTPSKERGRSSYQDSSDRKQKSSLEKKRERREEFERNYISENRKNERTRHGASPSKSYPPEDYSSPATERRDRSPDERSRSRRERYEEPERDNRKREARPADDRRIPRDASLRTDEFETRGRSPSTHSRERSDRNERTEHPVSLSHLERGEHYPPSEYRSGQDPRARYEEPFPPFTEHPDLKRPRYPGDREQFDPRGGRQRQDPAFDRGRREEGNRDRYNRFPDERGRMENFEGFERRGDYGDRTRGRGRSGGFENVPARGLGHFRPAPQRGRYEVPPFEDDRQNRRPEWDERRPPGEPFRPDREWQGHPDVRPDGRRDVPRDERYDVRRDDRRVDNRQFNREVEEPINRGRPDWRERVDSSIDRRQTDFRDERIDPRNEGINRMDERGRERVGSPKHPVDWTGHGYERGTREDRGYGDDRVPGPGFREERGKGNRRDERGFRDERDQRDDKRPDAKRIGPDDRVIRDDRGSRDDQLREERGPRDARSERERADDRIQTERVERDASKLKDKGSKDGQDRSFDKESYESRRKDERTGKDEDIKSDSVKSERTKEKRDESLEYKYRDAKDKEKIVPEDAQRHGRNDAHSSRDDLDARDKKSKFDEAGRKDEKKRDKSHKKTPKWPPRSFDDVESDGESSEANEAKKEEKRSLDEENKTKSSASAPRGASPESKRSYSPSSKRSHSPSKKNWSPFSKRSHSPFSKRKRSSPSKQDRFTSKCDRSPDSKRSHSSSRHHRSRSPPQKRARDSSPSGSYNSRRDHSRGRDRRAAKVHPALKQVRDEESDHDEKRSTAGSLDLERKNRKRESISEVVKKDKAKSLSPQPTSRKEGTLSKSEKAAKRKRSFSGASARSQDAQDKKDESKKRRFSDKDKSKEDKVLADEEDKKSAVLSPDKKSIHDSDMEGDLGTEPDAEVVFSDWSEDDLADNILNQEDEKMNEPPTDEGLRRVKEDRTRRSPSNSSHGSWSSRRSKDRGSRVSHDSASRLKDEKVKEVNSGRGDSKERHDQESEAELSSHPPRLASNPPEDVKKEATDMGLPEYESISSGEEDFLEEEPPKPSITDILNIDWSSLKQEPSQKPVRSSVLDRFKPANIFSRIGVSRKYAGEALFQKVKDVCQKELEETRKQDQDGQGKNELSKKPLKEEFTLHHDIPSFHCYLSRTLEHRANLMKDLGPHRRALCARRDLEIRQQLCKVDKVFDQAAVYPSQVMDTDLCKLSIQLFRRGREHTPEKKDSVLDSLSVVPCES